MTKNIHDVKITAAPAVFCQNCQSENWLVHAIAKDFQKFFCRQCAEQICNACGCTDNEPCAEACEWTDAGVCTNCEAEFEKRGNSWQVRKESYHSLIIERRKKQ